MNWTNLDLNSFDFGKIVLYWIGLYLPWIGFGFFEVPWDDICLDVAKFMQVKLTWIEFKSNWIELNW